jgi:hypothetical protein
MSDVDLKHFKAQEIGNTTMHDTGNPPLGNHLLYDQILASVWKSSK